MVFTISNKYFYSLVALVLVIIVSYVGKTIQEKLEPHDESKYIKDFLLNDSPLYGNNKPKIWIHTQYEINARNWIKFQSRNSTDLNQPYIHLTIKTIVSHCSKDFNICLIDDDTFEKLIPSWDIDMSRTPEPNKHRIRTLGLLRLVHIYGGMVVPNSFICRTNLREFYDRHTGGGAFACEGVNRYLNKQQDPRHLKFIPKFEFFGAKKNNEAIAQLIEFAKTQAKEFSAEPDFLGSLSYYAVNLASASIAGEEGDKRLTVVDGREIGIKTTKGAPIGVDEFMGDGFIDVDPDAVGILLPYDDILARNKYAWFAALSKEDILSSDNVICAKHLIAALLTGTDDLYMTKEQRETRSIVSI
jgi:hypothetical protein